MFVISMGVSATREAISDHLRIALIAELRMTWGWKQGPCQTPCISVPMSVNPQTAPCPVPGFRGTVSCILGKEIPKSLIQIYCCANMEQAINPPFHPWLTMVFRNYPRTTVRVLEVCKYFLIFLLLSSCKICRTWQCVNQTHPVKPVLKIVRITIIHQGRDQGNLCHMFFPETLVNHLSENHSPASVCTASKVDVEVLQKWQGWTTAPQSYSRQSSLFCPSSDTCTMQKNTWIMLFFKYQETPQIFPESFIKWREFFNVVGIWRAALSAGKMFCLHLAGWGSKIKSNLERTHAPCYKILCTGADMTK